MPCMGVKPERARDPEGCSTSVERVERGRGRGREREREREREGGEMEVFSP